MNKSKSIVVIRMLIVFTGIVAISLSAALATANASVVPSPSVRLNATDKTMGLLDDRMIRDGKKTATMSYALSCGEPGLCSAKVYGIVRASREYFNEEAPQATVEVRGDTGSSFQGTLFGSGFSEYDDKLDSTFTDSTNLANIFQVILHGRAGWHNCYSFGVVTHDRRLADSYLQVQVVADVTSLEDGVTRRVTDSDAFLVTSYCGRDPITLPPVPRP